MGVADKMSKFGPNGEQVERFLEKARAIEFDWVEELSRISTTRDVTNAKMSSNSVPRSAARSSAVRSAAQGLVRDLVRRFPRPLTTREKMMLGDFTLLLRAAVLALESRPELDDDTVGLVVDPFASRLGFEWRSWGVGPESGSGGS